MVTRLATRSTSYSRGRSRRHVAPSDHLRQPPDGSVPPGSIRSTPYATIPTHERMVRHGVRRRIGRPFVGGAHPLGPNHAVPVARLATSEWVGIPAWRNADSGASP